MQKDLTKGSVFRILVRFSLPYLLSCFLQTFYGMADLFVTGQFNGADTISAVSIGSQLMHMLTVIIVGLAMGSTVALSKAVGGKKESYAARVVGNTASLFLVASLLFTAALMAAVNGIIALIATPGEAVEQTRNYLLICFAGIPFITAYNIISCVFRGMGDSKSPMYFVAVAGVLNVVLDFLFIGPMHMGAAGAAAATVISQTISVFTAFYVLQKKDFGLMIKKEDFCFHKPVMEEILKVGLPIACQDGLIQVSFLVITAIANQRGVVVAASVGIVEKIITFLFLVPSAMLSSISAIAAQNIGAGKYERADKTLGYGVAIGICFGLAVAFICQFSAEPILRMFTDSPDVVRMGGQYLRSYVFDCGLAGVHFCFSGYFCAYGRSGISFVHNLTSILLIRIPGAYLASVYFPHTLLPMGMAPPLGSALSAIFCIVVFYWYRNGGRWFLEERGGGV
ncbi:MAG: MATE family efflux transporter [Lachnospiraceae bacterium]|jgi:putative MATE family efflux protein|nr:MATE family efflux transporter [Lachnospiraceae bacterium]